MSGKHKPHQINGHNGSEVNKDQLDSDSELWGEFDGSHPERTFFFSRRVLTALSLICMLPLLFLFFDQMGMADNSALDKHKNDLSPNSIDDKSPVADIRKESIFPPDDIISDQKAPTFIASRLTQRRSKSSGVGLQVPELVPLRRRVIKSPVYSFQIEDLEISIISENEKVYNSPAKKRYTPSGEQNYTSIPEVEIYYEVADYLEVNLDEVVSEGAVPSIDEYNMPPNSAKKVTKKKSKRANHKHPHFRYSGLIEPMYRVHNIADPNHISVSDRITNIGFAAGIQLNKHWSFSTGISFRDHDLNIEGIMDLVYTTDNIQTDDDGNQLGSYLIQPANNPLVNLRSTIVNTVRNDGEDIENGDQFGIDVSGRYRLKYHTIPAWVRYEFGLGNWYFNIRSGIQFHNLIGNEERYLTANVLDLISNGASDRLMVNNSTIQVETIQDSFIEAGFGFGVNYALTNSIDFSMEPMAYKAITAMFDEKPWSFGLTAGITIRVDPSDDE